MMELSPAEFLRPDTFPHIVNSTDLIILNQPLSDFEVFKRLWSTTRYRVCADGGANRLFDMFCDVSEAQRINFLPSIIHGDLDSLRDDVRQFYSSHNVPISQDANQDSTDFGKAVSKIVRLESKGDFHEIIVLGTISGRVDQGIGLLHEIFREQQRDSATRFWLFSESNVSFILQKGSSSIHLSPEGYFTEKVGILPIYGASIISTTGLEWDVTDWKTSMGTQVSTSNHVIAPIVRVRTTEHVLFTIERVSFLPAGKANVSINRTNTIAP